MSVLFQFLHIFCCFLVLQTQNASGFAEAVNGSSKFAFFDRYHKHTDDVELPKDFVMPEIMAGDMDEVMLISGGYRPAENSLSKYVVSIRTSKATAYFGDNHFCAGTIISERLVLTAAHCVVDRRKIVTRPHRLLVVAGAPNRLKKMHTTVERKVQQVLPHNQFVRKGVHDIALLLLTNRFPDDNDNIKVIPLVNEIVSPDSICQIVGWGQIFYRGPYAAKAIHANFNLFSYEYCRNFYPRTFHKSMLCGGRENAWDIDACRGDSGGPLICNGHVAGIISWGSHCGEKGKPTVFTSVYHHLEWINIASASSDFRELSMLHVIIVYFSSSYISFYCQLICLYFM